MCRTWRIKAAVVTSKALIEKLRRYFLSSSTTKRRGHNLKNMVALIAVASLLVYFTTFLQPSYSSCPKVSIAVSPDYLKSRNCSGTLLRSSTKINNIPSLPDTGGKKDYSKKTSFYLYEHLSGFKRFVSIRWSHNTRYALAEENGNLAFKILPNGSAPPDEFLFSRLTLLKQYEAFMTKSSKRYIVYNESNCSVSLSTPRARTIKTHRFRVECNPNHYNCFCIPE